jgi:hypothetical protein
MALIFEPASHSYVSQDPADQTKWTSVTTLIGHLKEPFDTKNIAAKSARATKSKWYGMKPEEIVQAWKDESERACGLGNWYHDQREGDILGCTTIEREGVALPVIHPMYDENNRKIASAQQLADGIYPELLVYLRSAGICGQSDLVEVVNGVVSITDYKTNKKIETKSYVNWEGISKRMLAPLSHLDDCHINHYALQLSIYMYIIIKHNPKLKPGSLTIHHISFEEEEQTNEFGYPVHKTDANGEPIIREITPYSLPYLRDEVVTLLAWYKANQHNLHNKKK